MFLARRILVFTRLYFAVSNIFDWRFENGELERFENRVKSFRVLDARRAIFPR